MSECGISCSLFFACYFMRVILYVLFHACYFIRFISCVLFVRFI
ncbi:hypothetical protein HMPREF3232_01211 [Fannyhessea vaginae]|nr:hypothetical protein HMPREF3232_01211 [Fannyhessea vaginae]